MQADLYQTIFKRKSVRRYDMAPLDEAVLNEISEHIGTLKPLYDNIKAEMKIVSQRDVNSLLAIKAPYYIVIASEPKEGYLTNAGFLLQQMDLFLSAKGIGSCWQGMPKPTREVLAASRLEFIIVLAFGKPAEPMYRESVSQFKRKNPGEISRVLGADDLLEAVRLAPSATNSQPWLFTGSSGTLHAYCVKSGFIRAIFLERMNKVDMGIALCHLWLAAKQKEMKVEFVHDPTAQSNPPSGYYYIATVKIG